MEFDLEFTLPRGIDVATYPPGATFGPRPMGDFEFVWMMEGDAEYRWNEQVVDAPEGSMVLCRPGGTDYFRWDTKRQTRHAFYHFNITKIPEDWPRIADWPLIRLPPEGDVLRPMFQHLLTWRDKGSETIRRLGIAHMLAAYVLGEVDARPVQRTPWPDAVERVWHFVQKTLDAHPEQELPLSALAEVGCVTEAHLCRVFKEATGASPVQAVRWARLDRAMTLVGRSNYSINEISRLYGFASPFHFSRVFKETYGLSPSEAQEIDPVRRLGAP